MTDLQKALILALAKANGHPDPEAYLAMVIQNYQPPTPAKTTEVK